MAYLIASGAADVGRVALLRGIMDRIVSADEPTLAQIDRLLRPGPDALQGSQEPHGVGVVDGCQCADERLEKRATQRV